jgi:CBS domain-containing protein
MPHPQRHAKGPAAAKAAPREIDERIDEALAESFPASDPPPWTLGAPRWSKPPAPPGRDASGSTTADRDRKPPAHAALQRAVAEIMAEDVHWVPSDMPLDRAAQELASRRISGAAVCAADGSVVGVLSVTDLTNFYGGVHEGRLVRDVMTEKILSIRPDEPLDRAIRVMAFERVHRLLVIDGSGQLVGIITSMDVLRELADFPRPRNHGRVVFAR